MYACTNPWSKDVQDCAIFHPSFHPPSSHPSIIDVSQDGSLSLSMYSNCIEDDEYFNVHSLHPITVSTPSLLLVSHVMTQCDNPTPSPIPTPVLVMSREAIPTRVQVHHHGSPSPSHHTHWLDRIGWDRIGWDGMGFHTCTCTFGCQTIHYTIIPWYQHTIWQCTTYPLPFQYPPLPSSHRVLSHSTGSLHHVVFNQDNSMIWQTPLWSSIDVVCCLIHHIHTHAHKSTILSSSLSYPVLSYVNVIGGIVYVMIMRCTTSLRTTLYQRLYQC